MKAKVLLTTLGTCLLASTTMADPAIYRDGKLVIPSAALITATQQQYYGDVVLNADATGKLQIVSAVALPPVQVDSVIAVVRENDDLREVKLTIAGNKSVPCVKLQEPAVSYKDGVFTVLLAESVMSPAESCIAVIDPFEITEELDVSKLPAGTYKVVANGKETSFVLTKNP